MGSEERLQEALLKRAQEAVDAAAAIIAHAEVITHVSTELREAGMTSRCAWCGRHRIGERWVLLGPSPLITENRTSHGICEDCVAALRAAGLSV